MNKFVTGALALAVAGSAANADPGNRDWLELDSEINTLATSMNATGDYTSIKLLLRGGYIYGKDGLSVGEETSKAVKDDSLSGVRLQDVEINGGAQIGDVKLRLGFDFHEGGDAMLQDAYALWDCGEFEVIAGHYKPHLLRTNFTDPENLFFNERSVLGSLYDMWDAGIGARGHFDAFSWSVDIMNGNGIEGEDDAGLGSGHKYLGRALWNINRDPGNYETDPEDAFGASDDFVGTVGIFLEYDDIYDGYDTDNIGIDFQGTLGQLGFGFEAVKRDDDAGGHSVQSDWYALNSSNLLTVEGDSTPWGLFGTYQIDEQFGVGLRFENLDNGGAGHDDNQVITLGANMYDVGHNGKIGVNIVKIDSDFDDSMIYTVGMTFGASR